MHPDDEVHGTALSLARQMAGVLARALGTARQLLRAGVTRSLKEQMVYEAGAITAAAIFPEAMHSVDPFVRGKHQIVGYEAASPSTFR